jgi:Common central domain of tyrosinase
MNRVTGRGQGGLLGRRALLGGVAAAAGGSALASRAAEVAVRQDIASAAQSPGSLASLDAAIGEMQRRSEHDPHDPKGWRAHAMDHHAVCAAVTNADDAQVHGSWWFLPWHRAFLAVTEWKLRAISGDPDLALPYWNWSSDRSIPGAFSRAESALARAVRYTPDRPLAPVEVDHLTHDAALARLGVAGLGANAFQARTQEQIPLCFGGIAKPNVGQWHGRSRIETIPHNAIHSYVGGEAPDGALGDMTELSTAALDPLFYAHHGNLDRLWEIWRADPMRKATEPDDDAFLRHRFPFLWLDGTVVTVSVAETLDTRRLGYVYDSLSVFRDGVPPDDAAAGPAVPRQPVATETLHVPAGAGGRTLRISGVMPSDRPMSVEIVMARPDEPASAISVGAFAVGRKHGSSPVFPDTEPRFDVGAAVGLLAAPTVLVSVLPLPLGPGQRQPPPFTYSAMAIVASTG